MEGNEKKKLCDTEWCLVLSNKLLNNVKICPKMMQVLYGFAIIIEIVLAREEIDKKYLGQEGA